MADLCKALGRLCCELYLQLWSMLCITNRYFERRSKTRNNINIEHENRTQSQIHKFLGLPDKRTSVSLSGGSESALELDSRNEPRIGLDIQGNLDQGPQATGGSELHPDHLPPILEDPIERFPQVICGNERCTSTDNIQQSATQLPRFFQAGPAPYDSQQKAMQDLHFDLAGRPGSCIVM